MRVLKFGGSSVGSANTMEQVIAIIRQTAQEVPCVTVLSAMQGTTDALIKAARVAELGDAGYKEVLETIREKHQSAIEQLLDSNSAPVLTRYLEERMTELANLCEGVRLICDLTPKTLDRILSFGELLSTRIVTARLTDLGVETEWHDSRELIRTDSSYGFAAVDYEETNSAVSARIAGRGGVHIVPGFIASDANGNTTTLGRGGSDFTAAILAAALKADLLEIWTDVSGMMSADPRLVKNVRQISHITYREAMELSHFGAKVIYPPTLQPVMKLGIPVVIKNTFSPEDHGTIIKSETEDSGEMIRGITSIDKISILNLEGSGMVGIPGFSKRLFDALSRAEINVILITQSSSEHSICVAIEERNASKANLAVDKEFENEIAVGRIDPLRVENGFSILAVVGDNMKQHTGISGKMFTTLGHNGINIHAIAQGSSERNISAVISSDDVRKAVNTLHETFFSDGNKQVNVFIAGVGTVGSRLLEQIRTQYDQLASELRLNIRVVGVANSRGSLIDAEGLDLASISSQIVDAAQGSIADFAEQIKALNLRNSVFVDVTASPQVVETYEGLLSRSISVIACNKIAASSGYSEYARLKDLSREYGANFFFETNVGAGLPVIGTLNDLLRSGDKVNRIEAVLSGTLNFVFNHYNGSRLFADVVRQAQDEGYTEPDPRLDLSGTDVARKILILAREAGHPLEMSDIINTSFLPPSCLEGTVDDFYLELANQENHFKGKLEEATELGLKLKYIASFVDGKCSVGLQSIGPEHDFSNLSGKDNAVLFYTNRYSEQPLVIKGAGAGADVTAAGVFADIIRAARV